VQLIDGNEAIYHTLWPKNATMSMFANGFISSFARPYTTYVVFDCYQEHSIKSHERRRRAKGAAPRDYNLTDETVLPARDIIMKSDQNKTSFIKHLCSAENPNEYVHIIGEECPYTHEEADVKLVSYLLHLHQQTEHIQVLADDTDIFVLLVYFVWCHNDPAQVSMKKYNGEVIDINATAMALGDRCQDLLPAHALSGCDSVSYPYGKGKAFVCSMLLKSKVPLRAFADPDASEEDWTREGFQFLSYLYGGVVASTLDGLRYLLFSKKKDPPKIKSLPPTSEAALQHIKRARIQVLTWRAADQLHPPDLDVSQYGWELNKTLLCPVNGTSTAGPPSLVQLVACGCKSSMPCGSLKCSCRAGGLSCTTYCKCGADEGCSNEHTKHESAPFMDGDENDEDDNEENAED